MKLTRVLEGEFGRLMFRVLFVLALALTSITNTIMGEEFVPTYEYQPIHKGVSVPPGLDVKIDLQGHSHSQARIPDPWHLQLWVEMEYDDDSGGKASSKQGVAMGASRSMDLVFDDGSSMAAGAMVGRPKKGCSHGCFARVQVHRDFDADAVKRHVLHDVCHAAVRALPTDTGGGAEHDAAFVCQLTITDISEAGTDISHHKPSMERLFRLSTERELKANVLLTALHQHEYKSV